MNFQTIFLSTVDNFVIKLTPVNNLVQAVVSKIIPQTIARACHTGTYCGSAKGSYCGTYHCEDDCKKIKHYHTKIKYDNTPPQDCATFQTCEESACDWFSWDGSYCPAPC